MPGSEMADRRISTSDRLSWVEGTGRAGCRKPRRGSCDATPTSTTTMAHSAPPTSPSARIRALWAAFEKTLPAAQRTTEHKTLAAHAVTDRAYDKLPVAARPTAAQHAATKDAQALELKKAYFDRAVKEWNARLAGAGLAVEMWTDITPEEMSRVTSALGEGQQSPPPPIYVQAPSLNSAVRGANASAASWHSTASSASGASYALVKPSEIYSEDEDDAYFAVSFCIFYFHSSTTLGFQCAQLPIRAV